MARRSPVKVALALALFCVVSYGQADDACRSGCRGAQQTFKYREGTTYKYNFDSKIEVSLSSAEGQKSTTEVKATVLLTQQPQCTQVLRLQNVQVISSDGKKHSQVPDVDKPISINYHDGHLEDSICITPRDSQNSLNLKRAIASAFQANLKNGHETDVFGLCPTEVTHHKEGNILVVQKSRNLNRCAYRENIKQDFLATAFNLNSEIKSSPILNGDYDAKLRIKNGILDQATIHEQYLYVPFSVGNNGVKASVETTLKYVGTSKDNTQVQNGLPRSIIFEDPHPVNSPHANVNSILAVVKQLAQTIDVTVGEHTAKEFVNLVKILRVSKRDDLLAVYNQVRAGVGFSDKTAGKKIFLDALLRAGNGDNIEVAIELLKNKELTPIEQRLVFLGLSTVRHPTKGSLTAAVTLLNQPNLPRDAYLGVGNLVGRFCRMHSCKNAEVVQKVTQALVQKLGKPTNRQQENDIVFVLKALGNFHSLSDDILPKITGIAQDKKAPTRLRVTALETYLADPCKDKLRESALSILKDIQQDSEVRIKAYLAAVQCPTNRVANTVKAVLENEPSFQVGGFIVSHLRNVRSSANPDKQLAKQYLGQIPLNNRFPIDPRRYSANGEFSYTIDTLGMANSIESNVIYSQKSFLPRSTSLNLTAEVFGHTFNFLELQTRQENLDRLIAHYLGPRGLFRSHSLQEIWDNKGKHLKEVFDDLAVKVEKSLRARRDITKAEIDHIAKQVQIKTNELDSDLDLDLSVKSFGSEVLFVNLNDDMRKYTPEVLVDKIVEGLNSGLDRIKHFEETLRSNLVFLDAELAYPTSSGYALRLGVEGASNIQVKASGELDIRSLFKKETQLKISLIPSASVQVSGRLTLDTMVVESGLKVVSTLHTSTGGDLLVGMTGNGFDVKFSLPVENQDLVSVSHDIVSHTREWGAPEVNAPLKFSQSKDFSICLDQLSPFIGLTFCGAFTGPDLQGEKVPILPFPLSGDAKASITIEREDLSHYHYKEVYHTGRDELGVEYALEAIGKNGNKKTSLTLDAFLRPEKVVKATLTSPMLTASVEGRITTTDTEKSILLRLVQDKDEYFGKVGVSVQGSPDRAIYKPIVEYKIPQGSGVQVPSYTVKGQVIVERKGPDNVIYNLDNVRLVNPEKKEISINGKLGQEPETVFADVTVSDGGSSASFNGKLRANPVLVKYNAELKNSVNPHVNIRVKGELSRHDEEIKNFFQIAHGGDFSDKNNFLTLENVLKRRPKDHLIGTKNKLTYPGAQVNLQLDFEAKPNAIQYEVDVQYGNIKLGSELEWEHHIRREGTDFELEFGVWGLNNRVEVKSKRQVKDEQSHIENSLEINGKRLEVNGKVKHHVRPQDVDVGADLNVKLPNYNTPFQVVSSLKVNANEFDGAHKVTSGGTVYVDIFLKVNKAGNANGSIKVNCKDRLVINGQVKANRGNGNGEIVVELPAAKRASKIDSTFTIHDPNYNVIVNIYPVFSEDKSKKITLSTHTSVTQHKIDSKNLVDIFGEKLEAGVKCQHQFSDEISKIDTEVEVTLPNHHYLAAKLNRDLRNVKNVLNGNVQASLEHRANKNQPGNKLTVKGQLKNTNPEEKIFDINYQISAERSNGQNLNVDLGVKRLPQGDSVSFELTNKIYGSELGSPVETVFKSNCHQLVGSFDIRSHYAPLGSLTVNGKHDLSGSGKPVSGEINVDVTSTSKVLRSLKAGVSGSILKTDVVDLKGKGSVYADAPDGVIVDLSGSSEVIAGENEGRVKGSVKSGKLDPVSFETGFSRKEDKAGKQVQGDLAVQYGKNQNIKADATLLRLSQHEYKLDVKFDTPTENHKNNRLQVHTKRNEDNTHHQSEVTLTSDGKVWTSNTDLVLSEVAPSIDIKVKCPEGKLRHLLAKVTKLSDRQLGAQLKLVNQKTNFLLEGTVDANVETIDDFHVKITANSPNLKIDKYVIEAQSKPAKTGRRIQVTAKSGNKNILAGSTSYTAREEHGKLMIEGSGSFKVREETKSANFKYIRENLSQSKNGETGVQVSFDAGLGNRAIDAELKVTNKQFRILNSYCEEKKECAHVEIDAKTLADDIDHYNQEIEIAVDLRKLGLSHEFGLKAVTNRKEYVLDHTVDVHFQSQDNSKYQYSLYLHPKEAGVSLTTPKRIVSLEASINGPPTLLKDGGRVTGEVVLYMDKKNQPNQKSGVIAFLDLNTQGQTLVGEARFTNPGLKRPLLVGFQSKVTPNTLEITSTVDVFAHPDQKLVVTYHEQWSDPKDLKKITASQTVNIKSSGLAVDINYEEYVAYLVEDHHYKGGAKFRYHVANSRYESAASYEVTPSNVQVLVKILNTDLFRLTSQMQLSKEHQVINSEVSCYGHKPLVSHLEVKNLNTLKYTLARKDNPNDKLVVNSGLIPGQIADFRAEIVKGGAPHELGHATIKLDDANFLKSDYNVQSKNIENLFLAPLRNGVREEGEELKRLSGQWSKITEEELKHLGEIGGRAVPNLAPLRQYYIGEFYKIKEEILADKTIRDISEFVQNVLAAFGQAFGDSFAHFSELVENIVHSLQNSFGKVIEAIQKELLPRLKHTSDKVLALAIEFVDTATEIVLTIGTKVAQIAEKYQPELQQLVTVLGEVTEDIFKATFRFYQAVKDVVIDQWHEIYNEIKSLPAVEQLRAEYERFVKHGLPAPEQLSNTVKDLLSTVKDLVPTEELKALVQAISDYLTAKVGNHKVDDKAAIDRIIKAGITAVRGLVNILTGQEPAPELQSLQWPLPAAILSKLPRLAAVRFSPLSYVLGDNLVVPKFFLLSLVNKPRNWIPPFPLYGLIAQGQHIFTFDGKHLTFPGNCNYLLAHDAVEGGFSVIGTYSNGLLTAISLTEGTDTITLKQHGQVLVNNAPAEFPARKNKIAAFRNTERIVLASAYGVKVVCGPELVVCSVTASGFYHGQVKGLLGNGNNEPYDDFTLPNGKIVTSESEFGNSYKTSSGCAAVQAVTHQQGHHASPSCDKLFGWESSLRYCYPFVSVSNYKLACEHGVAGGVKDTEHAIAVAYVAECNQHGIPVHLPSEYAKCTNGAKPTTIGSQFTVKTPGKSADIVVLVDTNKQNEPVYKEYVQPLIQQLTSELHGKGVNDVEFHIIAYGGENQWPSHITTGSKLTFKGKAPNLKFSEGPAEERLVTGCHRIDGLLEVIRTLAVDLKLALGVDLQAATYTEGLQYPFRANAVKTIIAVTSKPCQVGRFFPLQLLRTLLYRGNDINLNLITPVSRDGAKSEAKNIVGFNSRNVFALGQTKNKIKYFADLSKELTYHDYCIDFTVHNDGNVFVSDHILLQPKGTRKQFVQVTSHGIVDQLLGVEKEYECECKYVTPFTASNVCKVVSLKEKPQARKVGTKS
ncbi:apolipophorins [Tenebrio molitor]|uniref:apolipophorins n=1 Tax=Tenebrio molitor TaxID=7067 RepID=UPI003624A17D